MSPAANVNPRNDPFGGGTLTAAASPVDVGGSFGTPGASGFPDPKAGQIMNARNNSGTNVRIPYARLVPVRGRTEGPLQSSHWAHVPGVQMRDGIAGMPLGMEYDGLDSGELAWILGGNGGQGGTGSYLTRTAHSGMGFGVDRMQRLASQFYVENYFRAMFGGKVIDLAKLPIVSEFSKKTSSEIAMYQQYLTGASVLGSVDLPHLVNGLFRYGGAEATQLEYSADDAAVPAAPVRGTGDQEGFASGLFVLEKGPFLRGKIVEDAAMYMVAPEIKTNTLMDGHRKHSVARNLGDRLAFDALYAKMKQQGMFDWTPDGLILSKLESPSGDPLSSAEIDARQAQLFNVAIQGPAITKTWTGNPALQAMPLDKVFVVIVADISSKVDAEKTKGVGVGNAMGKLWDSYKNIHASSSASQSADLTAYEKELAAIDTAFTNVSSAVEESAYATAVAAFFKASKDVAADTTNDATLKTALEDAKAELRRYKDTDIDVVKFDAAAANLKQGTIGIASSSMSNFRLKRVTSSFLINNSEVKVDSANKLAPSSRCGLKLGVRLGDTPGQDDTYTGEYIIGGWCVGTVLDSAASRSAVGNQVRTAPASMAMSINVGVEWMSGDDLYRRYMDVDGTVQQRGVHVAEPPPESASRNTPANRQVGHDVNVAAQLEKVAIQEY